MAKKIAAKTNFFPAYSQQRSHYVSDHPMSAVNSAAASNEALTSRLPKKQIFGKLAEIQPQSSESKQEFWWKKGTQSFYIDKCLS